MADLENLPTSGDRFKLGNKVTSGVWGVLHEADDSKSGKKVAIKVASFNKEKKEDLNNEVTAYKSLPTHENIPTLIGFYKKQNQQIWTVTEYCDGGTVGDYVRGVQNVNKRLPEEHIAYILREVIKSLVHLHENSVVHRNVRADNILFTRDGKVKLCNLGYSSKVIDQESKLEVCVGSPCWLAPEIATCEYEQHEGYDVRADVWALGVTAIELGDGKPPFQDIHPARAIFQITRNPPPTLFRPSNWSQLYNDFIQECLEKNPENRPHSQELLEHPFFEGLDEKEADIRKEISAAIALRKGGAGKERARPDILIKGHYWEQEQGSRQKLLQEDLAALEDISEDTIVGELQKRFQENQFNTFIGDVLVTFNPYQPMDYYGDKYHAKYEFKARSDNSPHIYSIADKAFQDVLHNEEPQHIIFSGETMSGKTTNMLNAIDHLLYLGKGNVCVEQIKRALRVIHALGNAGTTHNSNSSRHLLQSQITFTTTGKISGAIFWLYLLEKTRVTTNEKKHANFNVFYYFYDATEAAGNLSKWSLNGEEDYRYLRRSGNGSSKSGARENSFENRTLWQQFEDDLKELGFDESMLCSIKNILAAIILLGEVKFEEDEDGFAKISNYSVLETVATLLSLDVKKFSWAMLNYCVVDKGEATRRHHKLAEASEARDVLAQGLYSRLVDWIICKLNEKLLVYRALYGDRHYISVVDLFGFECYTKNTLEQLFVNTVNEQLQFHYNQRIFVWEMQEGEEEEIPVPPLPFYDNKSAIDQLLAKPEGLMYLIDEASRAGGASLITERLQANKRSHTAASVGTEFTVAHYTGRVTYNAADIPDKNKDFLPPEMIETMRQSSLQAIQTMFTGLLSKSGNLTVPVNPEVGKTKGRWGAALTAEHEKSRARKYNTASRGQYSQTRQMRTAAATFRGTCLELLKNLSGGCGVHFVRCVRPNLLDQPNSFQADLVRQQIKALAILDTARGRQRGYSARIPFNEFIRRYKFLAFDFDEQVDVTKDNCRLLLVRLKMEGWVIGKTKVFLKYYNEEYLSRLYETQVKKIVKVQSMMRAFLAKRTLASKIEAFRKSGSRDDLNKLERGARGKAKADKLSQDEAATIIQKQIRGSIVRKQYGPMVRSATGKLDEETMVFIKYWCKRWKLKSMFQVLLLYRATRHQDFIYFCQQAHLYNQNALSQVQDLNESSINVKDVDPKAQASTYLPPKRPSVYKLPFRLGDMPYFDNTYICDPTRGLRYGQTKERDETWDAPLQRNVGEKYARPARGLNFREQGCQTYLDKDEYTKYANSSTGTSLPETPFVREPAKGVKIQVEGFKGKSYGADIGKNQVYRGISSSKKSAPPPPPPVKGGQIGGKKYNPIREMEDRFRQSSVEGDEPPFNFQAMLKKTNHKRESLKRSDNFMPSNNNNGNVVFSSSTFNNNNMNNKNNTKFGSDLQNRNVTPTLKTNESLELAPGLIVHGEVADL